MPNLERLELVGHLGRDPEPITKKGDGSYCGARLTLAVGHPRKDKQTGEWSDEWTNWWSVVVWGEEARVLEGLAKGDLVRVVAGRIKASVWTGRDGEARPQLEACARNGDVSRVIWARRDGEGRGGRSRGASGPSVSVVGEDYDDAPGGDVDIPF